MPKKHPNAGVVFGTDIAVKYRVDGISWSVIFKVRQHARRAITLLLYDHIGGFNTMLHQLL
jgi:hypothetical protein